MDQTVKVEGLAEFSRGLRQLDTEAPKQLRIALNGSAQLLIDRAVPKVPSVSGAARRSFKAKSTRTSARVAIGGKLAPYMPWLDFGGQGRITGRPAAREFIKEGRYTFVALREIGPDITADLNTRIRAVATNAGLDVD